MYRNVVSRLTHGAASASQPVHRRETRVVAQRCAAVAFRAVNSVDPSTERRPQTGRPRRRPRANDVEPREEIIAAAVELFAEKGFAGTTMSEIAAAAGLQQSSLYYWFNRKELILHAAFDMNRAPLDFLNRTSREPGSAGLRLYRLLRFDIEQLCSAPVDMNEVLRMAAAQPDVFADLWAERQALHDGVERLVCDGIDSGEFVDVDPTLTALNLLSADEGIPNWVRSQSEHDETSSAPFRHRRFGIAEAATHFAALALRGLLRRPQDLEVIERESEALTNAAEADLS
jgi:AcrR family transcriptional regulator